MVVYSNAQMEGLDGHHWETLNQFFPVLSILGIFSLQMMLVLA